MTSIQQVVKLYTTRLCQINSSRSCPCKHPLVQPLFRSQTFTIRPSLKTWRISGPYIEASPPSLYSCMSFQSTVTVWAPSWMHRQPSSFTCQVLCPHSPAKSCVVITNYCLDSHHQLVGAAYNKLSITQLWSTSFGRTNPTALAAVGPPWSSLSC